MRLSTAALSRYRRGIEGLSEQAATELVGLLEAYAERHPDATPEDVRRLTIRAAEQVLGTYGDGSSMLAATLYDEIMEREGAGVASAAIYGGSDAERTEGTVRRLAGRLAGDEPDWDGYLRQAANFVRDGVRRAARDTVTENVRRDRRTKAGRRVAYARVPTRADPCPYCAMLASRGFDYASTATAEAGSHHNCTCIIVPGIKGRTAVEGYDPDKWADYWSEQGAPAPSGSGGGSPSRLNKFVKLEVKRDVSRIMEQFDNVASVDEFRQMAKDVQGYFDTSGQYLTDDQVQGIRWAYLRAKKRFEM